MRLLFYIAAVVSLLLFLASLGAWKWSFGDTASRVVTAQPWVELDLVDGRLPWMKISGLTVERRDHWIDDMRIADLPRKLPDDWGTRFFDDGCFAQFTGDGRLITSEPVLLPIVRSPAFTGTASQTFPGITRIQGTFRQHGQVEIRSVSFMGFEWVFLILPLCTAAALTSGVCPECGTKVSKNVEKIA